MAATGVHNKIAFENGWSFDWTAQQSIDEQLGQLIEQHQDINYIVYGIERSPTTGSVHMQGYAQFYKQCRRWMDTIKELLNDPATYVQRAKGSVTDNQIYCKKEGWRVEFGEARLDGKRSNGNENVRKIKQMILDGYYWHQILNEYFQDIDRCWRAASSLYNAESRKRRQHSTLTSPALWQQSLISAIEHQQLDAKLYWYKDEPGGSGKSTVARYLSDRFACYLVSTSGKSYADLTYGFQQHIFKGSCQRVVICDFPYGTNQSDISYSWLEGLLNGTLFSSKYESGSMIFDPVSVLVFANISFSDELIRSSKVKQIDLS